MLPSFFTISEAGFSANRRGFGKHMHDRDYEFHYLPSANCVCRNGPRRFLIPDHSIIYTEPHTVHDIVQVRSKKPVQWYFFRFVFTEDYSRIMLALRKAFDLKGYIRLSPLYDARFRNMLVQLRAEDELLRISGAHLLASLMYELASVGRQQSLIQGSEYVDGLFHYMQQNMSSNLELDKIAKKMGIDKAYLIRLFKQKTGSPPVKFFNKLKIDAASYMLEKTDLAVYEISEQIGFCDEFYFSRLFKQYMGMAPSEYRKAME